LGGVVWGGRGGGWGGVCWVVWSGVGGGVWGGAERLDGPRHEDPLKTRLDGPRHEDPLEAWLGGPIHEHLGNLTRIPKTNTHTHTQTHTHPHTHTHDGIAVYEPHDMIHD
jgi:hypothetical protein